MTEIKWHPIAGKSPYFAAQAFTADGRRLKVDRRRMHLRRWVAWVDGTVIGDTYRTMEAAKAAAEEAAKQGGQG